MLVLCRVVEKLYVSASLGGSHRQYIEENSKGTNNFDLVDEKNFNFILSGAGGMREEAWLIDF